VWLREYSNLWGCGDHIRRIKLLAIGAVGDDRDRAVELGASDPPAAVLASDQAPFAVDGIAVGQSGQRLFAFISTTIWTGRQIIHALT
jgi:hypothetical protein